MVNSLEWFEEIFNRNRLLDISRSVSCDCHRAPPSSGAAMLADIAAHGISKPASQSYLAAPEDGRAPLDCKFGALDGGLNIDSLSRNMA